MYAAYMPHIMEQLDDEERDEFPARLDKEISEFWSHTFADSTKHTYDSHRRSYFAFCAEFNYPPIPVTQPRLLCYTAHLARRLKPTSIRKYLNIIRLLHIEARLPNPLLLQIMQSAANTLEAWMGIH